VSKKAALVLVYKPQWNFFQNSGFMFGVKKYQIK